MAWVRLYTETKNDRKIRRLDPAHRWLWCVLLMMAKESPVEGWLYIAEGEPATIDDIADEANLPIDVVGNGLGTFRELSFIEEVDGVFHLINWEKRQFKSDISTSRTRKHREQHAEQGKENDGVPETSEERSGERSGNVPGTPPEYRVQSNNITPPIVPPYAEIVSYLNEKAGTSYRAASKKTQRHINARWCEGYRLDDFRTVIDKKVAEWKDDPKMAAYLRPETLFGSKFESYLNQPWPPRASPEKPTYLLFNDDNEEVSA